MRFKHKIVFRKDSFLFKRKRSSFFCFNDLLFLQAIVYFWVKSMIKKSFFLSFFLLACAFNCSAKENKKILICGICKNIEAGFPVTSSSIDALKDHFEDYRVIIYENNSKDNTKKLLKDWSTNDPKILVLSTNVSHKELRKIAKTGTNYRTEKLAIARNALLDEIMKPKYEEFSYVVMADLDMNPWDIQGIIDTINTTKYEWDVVCANGSYDRYAFRNEEYPFGPELLGKKYWEHVWDFDLHLSKDGDWKPVYSAFGGLAIYKRNSIKGCRYEGVVTKELEDLMANWIEKGIQENAFLSKEYLELKKLLPIVEVKGDILKQREKFPEQIGMILKKHGSRLVWFGSEPKTGLPMTCEHVPFHAMMIAKGCGKIYINPSLKSTHP
ncbi:MAG: hypothetical protein EBZ47_01060 [Chlamydiae bacterium]|nr:hypothetical protein [Chlamydiota bacterium]